MGKKKKSHKRDINIKIKKDIKHVKVQVNENIKDEINNPNKIKFSNIKEKISLIINEKFDLNKKKIIFISIYSLLLLSFLVLNINSFYAEKVNGTGIVNGIKDSDYKFTPFLKSENDEIVQVFKPDYSHLNSMAIRLANEHGDQISCDLHFKLLDENENLLAENIVNSKDIGNWQYYTWNLNVKLNSFKEYKLEINSENFKSEVPFKVFICNEKLDENKELYFNNSLQDGGIDILYSYNACSSNVLIGLIILVILSAIISLIKKSENEKHSAVKMNLLLIISMICSLAFVELLSYNNPLKLTFNSIIITLFIISIIYYFILFLFNRYYIAIISGDIICLIIGLINHVIMKFRGTVVLPVDIYSLNTAIGVAGSYKFGLDVYTISSITFLVVSAIVLFRYRDKKNNLKYRILTAVAVLILSVSLPVAVSSKEFVEKLHIQVNQFYQTKRSHEIGFILNFAVNIPYSTIQKPDNYSYDRVKDIENQIKTENTNTINSDKNPTVIAIMNESFSDLSNVGELKTNTDYMPFIHSLSGNNVKKGYAVIPVFGGDTGYSEFEFLTGASKLFLGEGTSPYQQYIRTSTPSLVSVLNQQGYTSLAFHPEDPLNYNRHIVYPLFGFAKFFNAKNSFENAEKTRGWISDRAVYKELIDNYKNKTVDDNLFMFAVTMENHGGYDKPNFENTVTAQGNMAGYADVNQYLSSIKDCDTEFSEFISYFKNVKDPVIILMYGDHLPSLSKDFYKKLFGKDESKFTPSDYIKEVSTPYVIWANFDLTKQNINIPDVISVNLLAPYLLKFAGLNVSDYQEFLYDISKDTPVLSSTVIEDKNQKMYVENDTSVYNEIIQDYKFLQYNLLFDKNNRDEELFSVSK